MKVYSYSDARQNLAGLLDAARSEEVIITRRDGSRFRVIPLAVAEPRSPFDIEGPDCRINRDEIVATIREGRERVGPGREDAPPASVPGISAVRKRRKKNPAI
jgi:prevent-host-death family protein